MRINISATPVKIGLTLIVVLTFFALNAGCGENTAGDQVQSGPTATIETKSDSGQAAESSSASTGARPFPDSPAYEWDPFIWMREFRREMEHSFDSRYDPSGGRLYHGDEPFQWLQEVQDEMDHFFDRSRARWQPMEDASFAMVWTPRVDMYEDDDNVVVRVDLPGMDKDGIEITVTGSILTLKGEKKEEKEIKQEDYQRWERSYGSFQRSITLPPYADIDHVVSSYKDGVLEIKFPRKAEPVRKQIKLT